MSISINQALEDFYSVLEDNLCELRSVSERSRYYPAYEYCVRRDRERRKLAHDLRRLASSRGTSLHTQPGHLGSIKRFVLATFGALAGRSGLIRLLRKERRLEKRAAALVMASDRIDPTLAEMGRRIELATRHGRYELQQLIA